MNKVCSHLAGLFCAFILCQCKTSEAVLDIDENHNLNIEKSLNVFFTGENKGDIEKVLYFSEDSKKYEGHKNIKEMSKLVKQQVSTKKLFRLLNHNFDRTSKNNHNENKLGKIYHIIVIYKSTDIAYAVYIPYKTGDSMLMPYNGYSKPITYNNRLIELFHRDNKLKSE